jgi:hypothetical protein
VASLHPWLEHYNFYRKTSTEEKRFRSSGWWEGNIKMNLREVVKG